MFWIERWHVGTNTVYNTASIEKTEGWFFWYWLEDLAGKIADLVMYLPEIPVSWVDSHGEPYEDFQNWYWTIWNKQLRYFSSKYKHTYVEVDLQQVPKELHLWDFECDCNKCDHCDRSIDLSEYQEYLEARERELEARKTRYQALDKVLNAYRAKSVQAADTETKTSGDSPS